MKAKLTDQFKYAEAEPQKVEKVMKEGKAGRLHSGSKTGPIVAHGSKQEIAIALAEARKAGEPVKAKRGKK